MSTKTKALGKDLAAILGQDVADTKDELIRDSVVELSLDKIIPNPSQPRQTFKADSIQELAESIKEQGLMQPIIVRPRQGTVDEYELIAGERRWRAATKAGLGEIPAIVRDITDEGSAALALIENMQREDLNPYEQAVAMEELRVRHSYTQQQLADILSKSRAMVANMLRLLKLEQEVKDFMLAGKLDMGHAKVLLSLVERDQIRAAEEAVRENLSVREVEKLVQNMLKKQPKRQSVTLDPNITSLQEELSNKLGVRVVFNHKKNGMGRMVIHYHSADELEGVLKTLHLKKVSTR
ncbi:MAG: ParB/RepB/Spo0J family partition protein [Gammaproteobacteria bacterium]|nr:ParB/RepB/Spo0J family partition protein [Gammaproteobacteria bacterium]